MLMRQNKYKIKVSFYTSETLWIKAFSESEAREKIKHMFGDGTSFPGVYSGQRWKIDDIESGGLDK